MWHEVGGAAKDFFRMLVETDEKLAERERGRGCWCGGRLHRADYPRKPRGVPREWETAFARRISFCCAERECRQRRTPPSVRFLCQRVYIAAVVIWCRAGWTPAVAVPARTVRRWRHFWTALFSTTTLWRATKSRFMPPVAETALPASLVERFTGDRLAKLSSALSFLAPLTTKRHRR